MPYLPIILIACSAAVFLMALTAPVGWEDADGFHFGQPPHDHPHKLPKGNSPAVAKIIHVHASEVPHG